MSHCQGLTAVTYCKVIQRILKECDNFNSFINEISDKNERKPDFSQGDIPVTFTAVYSTESKPLKEKTRPTYLIFITEDHFRALFKQDFEPISLEDEFKQVYFLSILQTLMLFQADFFSQVLIRAYEKKKIANELIPQIPYCGP